MDWVRKLFRLKTCPPPGPRDGDIIYPLHFLDNEPNLGKMVPTWTMRFNDALDYEMLYAALIQVLETGDWRKLGGRLAKKDNRLYIYVPKSFTAQRPAVNFSHEEFQMGISQHPWGKLMPGKVSGQPTINTDFHLFFRPLSLSPGTPLSMEDYLSREVPILSLHIVTFKDATLVSISWPHAVMDAMSLRGISEAWSIALRGKVSEIPPLLGAKEDVLDKFTEKAIGSKEFMLQPLRLAGLGLMLFVVHFIYQVVFGPAMKQFLVALPKSTVDRLRKEVEAELGSLEVKRDDNDNDNGNGNGCGKEELGQVHDRISRGDILFSWFILHIVSAMSKPRPVVCSTAINLRKRLPGVEESGGSSSYVQNMIVLIPTPLSASEAATASIGRIARYHRRSLMAQATADQLIAYLQTVRREAEKARYPLVITGEPNSLFIHSTNWTIVDICKVVDFSPAVVRSGEGPSRSNPPGSVVYHYLGLGKDPLFARNGLGIYGTDHDGTYWLGGYVDARTLSLIKESIRELSS